MTLAAVVEQLRQDIRDFKAANQLDSVVVLWTANTESYCQVLPGVNTTSEELLEAIRQDRRGAVSPSTLYGVASVLESAPFINGSPQNTFVPGLVALAVENNVMIAGDDFKSGQTKVKSVLADFLITSGLRLESVVSYNHLGNNDGKNLSHASCFKSKEISKTGLLDRIAEGNCLLYDAQLPSREEEEETAAGGTVVKRAKGPMPDHAVVIKYVPSAGDSKRALDEYSSEIFLGGKNTISLYNICEDSLLAAPIIIDMAVTMELLTRITMTEKGSAEARRLHPVATVLSFFSKKPIVPEGVPGVNSLARQRLMLENFLRACAGLLPDDNSFLQYKLLPPTSTANKDRIC